MRRSRMKIIIISRSPNPPPPAPPLREGLSVLNKSAAGGSDVWQSTAEQKRPSPDDFFKSHFDGAERQSEAQLGLEPPPPQQHKFNSFRGGRAHSVYLQKSL